MNKKWSKNIVECEKGKDILKGTDAPGARPGANKREQDFQEVNYEKAT